jgi:integrase
MWRWGESRGLARSNPWRGLRRFPEQKKGPPPLTDADLDLFCALVPNEAVRLAAIVSLETGLRVSEVRRLRWGDVRGRELHVVSGYARGLTKNRRERWLALTDRALEALGRAKVLWGDDLLARMPTNYRRALHAAQDAAGVGRWRWHDLRHLALTRAARWLRRADLRAMAGWVGDESARYVHEDAQGMAAMVAALDCARVVPTKTAIRGRPRRKTLTGGSSNGRTPVSGSGYPPRND